MQKNTNLIFFILFVAIVFVILSAALFQKAHYGLFVFFPYAMIPVLGPTCAAISGDTDSSRSWNQFGYFMESFLWVSAFGIPAVCLHVEQINLAQYGWLLGSNFFVLAAYIAFGKIQADNI